jgi:arsenite methyltransferase
MHRVLRSGGRIGISDVVASDSPSRDDRARRGSYVGCIAGALSFDEYEQGLREAGFDGVELTPTHEVADGMFAATVKAIKR